MSLKGIKLEFHDGAVFRARENIVVRERRTPLWKINGFQNLITIYNEFYNDGGQPGRANGNDSGAFIGWGAGVRSWSVEIYQYKANGQTWGDADTSSDGDSAYTLLQTLGNTLSTVQADSDNPAIFETGEYSSSGKYNPVAVAIGESDLPKDFGVDGQPSSFRGTVELHDSIDLSQAVSAVARRG